MNIPGMDSIQIPLGLSSTDVKEALEGGHGYDFFLLVKSPTRIEIGIPGKSGLPQLAIIGNRLAVEHTSSSLIRETLSALHGLYSGGEASD
ncbi:MAG: hypothetical protein GF309_16910 [Candidatus Lokiarchaeota archaeon]|jgi:hypothetical protein|nr:hypothetical protein [Candidatus Lokiarchaeota archaeon]